MMDYRLTVKNAQANALNNTIKTIKSIAINHLS